MTTMLQQIIDLIEARPGIRTMDIAEELGIDGQSVRPTLHSRISNGDVVVSKVSGVEGRHLNAYFMKADAAALLEGRLPGQPATHHAEAEKGPSFVDQNPLPAKESMPKANEPEPVPPRLELAHVEPEASAQDVVVVAQPRKRALKAVKEVFRQEMHSMGPSYEEAELTIQIEDAGGGEYVVIHAAHWAVGSTEEVAEIAEKLLAALARCSDE